MQTAKAQVRALTVRTRRRKNKLLTKTQGLILKVNKLGENDCLFTILTRDMKKLTAISKGIRSLKHKDFAALKLFCYSELELSNKGGLYYVSSANVTDNFYNIRNSVEKLSLATYISDISSVVSELTEGDGEYFRFILNTLYFIEHADECDNMITELKKLKCLFELRSACFAGFAPNLLSCTSCSQQKNLMYFDIEEGGAVCDNCRGEYSYYISMPSLKTMHFLCFSDLKSSFKMPAKKEEVFDEINSISEKYISAKTEYYFKSLDYLKSIINPSM